MTDTMTDTTTTTFTADSMAAARDRLREQFDTEIVIENRAPTVWHWAAKRAIAWGRIVPDLPPHGDRFIVEVTTAPVYVVVGDNDVPTGSGGGQWVEAVHAHNDMATDHAAKLAHKDTEYTVEPERVRSGPDFADD